MSKIPENRDLRWLELRSLTWHVVQYVPRPVVPILGRRKMVASLKTRDLREAQTRRHGVLQEWARLFEQARQGTPATPQGHSPDWLSAAGRWRATFAALSRGDASAFTTALPREPGETKLEQARHVADAVLDDELDRIEHGESIVLPDGSVRHLRAPDPTAARTFRAIATSIATPLLFYLDQWLSEGGKKGPLNPRTQAQYRSDLQALETWCRKAGVPATIEAITKPIAGRFVTEELVGKRVHWATANRKITAASAYWRWLIKRTEIEVNPWTGQSLSKISTAKGGNGKPKRPFTDAEVVALLTGEADQELHDLMRVAALTGARLEELYRLTIADCVSGWFVINRAKTDAGLRKVPVHSALAEIVTRRTAGKPAEAFLFHEARPMREGRERSAAVSKRFGKYRQRVGVHERAEGVRHSKVDFHSFRRWFITQARNAGIDRAVVAAVVGHETGHITDDVYSGGPSDPLLRQCVEAVCFPTRAGISALPKP